MTQPCPKISVVVAVYNVQAHIGACIASLRDQSFTDFEAIVVDDGSTDDSPARLRDAIAGDPRFTVIRQDNLGLSAARNAGLNQAKGAFIAFLDGDDRYAPAFLERLHGALRDSGADWVACGMRNIHPGLRPNTTHSTIHDAPKLAGDRTPRLWPLSTWDETIVHFPSAWNKLYRRDLIEGLRFDTGTWFEDHAFFLRVAARSEALLHLPEPLYLQTRGRVGQITASDSDRVFEQFAVLDTVADLLAGPEKPGGDTALSRLAHRLIRERSAALRDPERRARFRAAAHKWLARRGLPTAVRSDLPQRWVRDLARAIGTGSMPRRALSMRTTRDTLRAHLAPTARHLRQFWRGRALQSALAEVATALHDRPDVPGDLLDNLTLPPARVLPLYYATLSEPFCQRDGFDLLYDHARRHLRIERLNPTRNAWFNSGLLPFLLRTGRTDLLQTQLRLLVDKPDHWLMTTPLAWTIRAALKDVSLPGEVRDDMIRSYLAFLDRRASDYWARTPCLSLIDTVVALIAAGRGWTQYCATRPRRSFCGPKASDRKPES